MIVDGEHSYNVALQPLHMDVTSACAVSNCSFFPSWKLIALAAAPNSWPFARIVEQIPSSCSSSATALSEEGLPMLAGLKELEIVQLDL